MFFVSPLSNTKYDTQTSMPSVRRLRWDKFKLWPLRCDQCSDSDLDDEASLHISAAKMLFSPDSPFDLILVSFHSGKKNWFCLCCYLILFCFDSSHMGHGSIELHLIFDKHNTPVFCSSYSTPLFAYYTNHIIDFFFLLNFHILYSVFLVAV